jgi:hypothetical protein
MNNQPPIIIGSPPPATSQPKFNLSLVLIIFLGLGTIGFSVASILAYGQAHTATASLESAKTATAATAKAEQKAADDKATVEAAQSPFRSYHAPDTYGAFVINFPKNWNMTVDQEESSNNQVSLVLNPDFIRRINSVDDLAAAKVQLIQRTLADFLRSYTSKDITQSKVTVTGIASIQLTGNFSDKRTVRMVAVPVRDKTLVFTNENASYSSTFDTILAQAKINP